VTWSTTRDVSAFLATAGDLLRARRAENTIMLTTTEALRVSDGVFGGEQPWFGWWTGPDGRVEAAFLRTPPYPVVLTATPDAALASLVDTLRHTVGDVDRINAEQRLAGAVAAEWERQGGPALGVHQHYRLYRLDRLIPPDPVPPGRARLAEVADRDRLLWWYRLFEREAGEESPDPAAMIDDRLDYGGLTVWEVDGVPVSMAGQTRPAAGMLRVGPVFTPVELRRRGYAAAVTAAVSRAAKELVDEVLLFTDMANPTSNSIYQRLGYRPIADRLLLAADVPAGPVR
jgi:hypothetical protein